MAGRLATFLDQATRTPFAWGRHDCLLFPADWLIACGHADPAAAHRGRYRSGLGAARAVARAGGLLPLCDAAMHRIGLSPVSAPQVGDVGLVEAMTIKGPHPVGGIWAGAHWAVLGVEGLLFERLTPLRIWRA